MYNTFELTEEQASLAARHLLRTENVGTLATNFYNASPDHDSMSSNVGTYEENELDKNLKGPEGWPYCIFDYYVDLPEAKGDPILFMSSVQNSVNNIKHDQRSCFTVRTSAPYPSYSGHKSTPMTCGRVALFGVAEKINPKVDPGLVAAARAAFVTCHPEVGDWINFKDFRFYRLRVDQIYWVGGFGNPHYIGWVQVNLYTQVPESNLPSQKIGYDSIQSTHICSHPSNLIETNRNRLIKNDISKLVQDLYSSQNSLAFRAVICLLTFYIVVYFFMVILGLVEEGVDFILSWLISTFF